MGGCFLRGGIWSSGCDLVELALCSVPYLDNESKHVYLVCARYVQLYYCSIHLHCTLNEASRGVLGLALSAVEGRGECWPFLSLAEY